MALLTRKKEIAFADLLFLFNAVDTDEKGYLTQKEMKILRKKLGEKARSHRMELIFILLYSYIEITFEGKSILS